MSKEMLNKTPFSKAPNRARQLTTVLGLVAASLVATLGLGGPSFARATVLEGTCSEGESAIEVPAALPTPVPVSAASPLACGDTEVLPSQ